LAFRLGYLSVLIVALKDIAEANYDSMIQENQKFEHLPYVILDCSKSFALKV
jgi:hypothetical protein